MIQRSKPRLRSLRFCQTWVTLSLLGVLALHLHAQQIALVTLSQLKDQFRPLLIFAPQPDDPRLEIQVRTLQEHAIEVQDRDLAVLTLPYGSPSPSRLQLTPADAEAARRHFGIAPGDFAVILLGKDGGEKLRSGKPLSIGRLEQTIDAMPMRQDEVRTKNHSAGTNE